MKKRLLYLSIAFLSAAILALIIVATRSLCNSYYHSPLATILFKAVFIITYIIFPLFFIYLIIAETNLNFMYQHSLRKRQHKRTSSFTLSLITLALVLLSLLARLFL
ncbi:hypothetical protein ABC973_00845 [Capnocytophaga sputigena]|uniref:hypothetical protein n=1 Tax=Capnocytophaga sputigena TaxID=1019 RepID=UPI0028E97FA2|nr:hypothetical protein [Capnocytophaga sputigena]